MTGAEISKHLDTFQKEYLNEKGYNSILKKIRIHSDILKTIPNLLNSEEIQDLKIKMKFWKQKLNF